MKLKIIDLFYYIGAGIILSGTFFLMLLNLDKLGLIFSIAVTIGIGFIAFLIGIILNAYNKHAPVEQIFYLISSVLILPGIYLIYYALDINICSRSIHAQIYGILFLIYFISYFLIDNTIFIIFNLIFGTLFFYYFFLFIFEKLKIDTPANHHYLIIAISIIYLLLAHLFKNTGKKSLSDPLFVSGIIGILFSTFLLGGLNKEPWIIMTGYNPTWQILFLFLCLGLIIFGKYLKEKFLIYSGSFALILFTAKILFENLNNIINWPILSIYITVIIFLLYKIKD